MIQSVKLDGPTPSRESSQGDSGDSGFSSMLANLVKPETRQKAQTIRPQERVEASVRREKPQEAPKAEVSHSEKPQESHKAKASDTTEQPKAKEKEQATQSPAEKPSAPTEQKPPTKASRHRETDNQPAEKTAEKAQDQPEPAAQVDPKNQAAIAQLPVELPKPLAINEAPPTETAAPAPTLPTAAPLATAPPPPEAEPISDQKTEPVEGQPSANPAAANTIPPEAIPLVPLPAVQVPAQAVTNEPEPAEAETKISSDKAPPNLDLKAALKPQVQVKATPDKTEASAQELSVKKKTPSVSTEITKDSARTTAKANSTEELPTTQTAEAALGLKPPSPKPALTEFLSRPAPAMETPSVVQTIQEARNANSTPAATPVTTALPGIESSRGSELFQGREFHGGQGSQNQAQPSSTGSVSAGFTLDAPAATQAKASIPEVAATRPSLPMEQMEGTVRWILKNDQNSAELQLRPESLGKVQIQLKVEGNQVHAKVWASEPSTVPLLESHRGMLEASLREQGLSLGSFDLHQGHGSPRHPTEQSTGQASFAGPFLDLSKEPTLEIPVTSSSGVFGNRRVEVFA